MAKHNFYFIYLEDVAAMIANAVAPWSIDGFTVFNCMMTDTCKFSKKSLLIPGHDTYGAEQWAIVLLRMLLLV
jgi:hypothetical protein